MQRAAIRLALTPVPALPALLEKIRVIKKQELDEAASMTRPALEVLAEDVRRLSSEAAPVKQPVTFGASFQLTLDK